MKTLSHLKNLAHNFFAVGPATKGWRTELILLLFALISLASFLFFTFSPAQPNTFLANATVISGEKSSQ